MITLRPYQSDAIQMTYDWMRTNEGNPCLVLPTGSGKSIVVAELCRDALETWPGTKILMLTHQKELIEQNYAKLKQHWPIAPVGIYSASVGKKQTGYPITFAGIQSIWRKPYLVLDTDLIIIDEAHTVSHRDEGSYRVLIEAIRANKPACRVVGLTATPFRLGHGYITDKPALFDFMIEPVSIEALIYNGYLSKLVSKSTDSTYDMQGVHKRGGEYIESEMQAAVDTDDQNRAVVDEVLRRAGERRHWLFFCAGVNHAKHISAILNEQGIVSACVHGELTKTDREHLLDQFKSGQIQALTNCNVLTTGFDFPDIDLIALMRPTLSPGLYMQMVGRGMRLKGHTDHCLILDFAGVIRTHGPIIAVNPPKRKGEGGGGEAPVKVCPECQEILHLSAMECPSCGYIFPRREKELSFNDVDIMGQDINHVIAVQGWQWGTKKSKTGYEMLVCKYIPELISDAPVRQYFTVAHPGGSGDIAIQKLFRMAIDSGVSRHEIDSEWSIDDLDAIAARLNRANPPTRISFIQKLGQKFPEKIRGIYETQDA